MKKRLTKAVSLMLIAAMITSLLIINASAAGNNLSIGIASGNAGSTVSVPVSVDLEEAASGLGFEITYDNTALTLDSTTLNPDLVTASEFGENLAYDADTAKFLIDWVATPKAAVGTLFYLNFTIKNTATTGNKAITFTSNIAQMMTGGPPNYDYCTVAIDDGGVTVTEAPTLPDTPTGLSATAGDGQVALDWNEASGADSYTIDYGTTSGALTSTTNRTDSNVVITGLTNGTTYYFSVRAYNSEGFSASTGEVSATPQAAPLVVPAGLVADVGDGFVGLNWNDVSGATVYRIAYGTTSGSLDHAVTSTVSSVTINPLVNGTTYYFSVRAENGGTSSAYCSEISATPNVAMPTYYLTNLTISAGTFTPSFASSTTAYSMSVANAIDTMTVTPTANNAAAEITVNSNDVSSGSASAPISLSVGSNTITVHVADPEDASEEITYTLTVSRASADIGGGGFASSGYTVSYDGNGNTGGTVPAIVHLETGETLTVSGNTGELMKTGYTFNGWNTKADGTGTAYTEGTTLKMESASVVLYAQWKSRDNTISYNNADWASQGANDYIVAYRDDLQQDVAIPTSYYRDGFVFYPAQKEGSFKAKYNFVAFDDVAETYWGGEYIYFMSAREVINGMGNRIFAPEDKVTRAQFLTMLARMTDGLNVDSYASSGFSDVLSGSWYERYVNWGVANGIIYGYGNGSFGPGDSITREQMCCMITRYVKYLGFSLGEEQTMLGFADQGNISSWALSSVTDLQKSGFINGRGNNLFVPLGTTTRAEAAALNCRILRSIINQIENPASIEWKS